jgi:predicted DNA-binding transcriptional regulator AlpA
MEKEPGVFSWLLFLSPIASTPEFDRVLDPFHSSSATMLPAWLPVTGGIAMKLVELVEQRSEALRVRDVAPILGISIQQVYKMAACGQIPSFRIASSVRFDPQVFADWMRQRYPGRPPESTPRQVRTA